MSDFVVKIEYMNKNKDGILETVIEKEYDFLDYTYMLYTEIMGILKETEDSFYAFANGEQKENWEPSMLKRFNSIRHKMLDEANAIKRLPQNLSYKGIKANQIPFSEFIARTMK